VAKAVLVLVLTLDGLKDFKNCGLKTKKVLRPFLDLKDRTILILDKAKFQVLRFLFDEANLTRKPVIIRDFFGYRHNFSMFGQNRHN